MPDRPERGIVFGVPRSGTTFLMRFLDASPEAECVTGNLLPIGVAHLAAQPVGAEVLETLRRSFRGSLAEYLTTAAYLSRSAALRKWWAASRRPAELPTAARGTRVETSLIYKEPFLAFAPDLAYEAFPESPLVYIFRDGRDVAESLVRTYEVLTDEKLTSLETNEVVIGRRAGDRYVPWWVADDDEEVFLEGSTYVRAILMWRAMVRRCADLLDRPDVVASKRILPVRYEDLVRDPVREGERIAAHLGREMNKRMREQLETAHVRSVGKQGRHEGAEAAEAERLAGAELVALGYELRHGADAATR